MISGWVRGLYRLGCGLWRVKTDGDGGCEECGVRCAEKFYDRGGSYPAVDAMSLDAAISRIAVQEELHISEAPILVFPSAGRFVLPLSRAGLQREDSEV